MSSQRILGNPPKKSSSTFRSIWPRQKTQTSFPSLCFPARQAKHGTSAHVALWEGLVSTSLCKSHLKCFLKSVKYTSRKASQKRKVKENNYLKTMPCFPSRVNFLILWNYRQVTRNTEYWESAVILCKPLTPTYSPFSASGWVIQVNFREKNHFKKVSPLSR